jgi:hypothetical protein
VTEKAGIKPIRVHPDRRADYPGLENLLKNVDTVARGDLPKGERGGAKSVLNSSNIKTEIINIIENSKTPENIVIPINRKLNE